MIEKEYLHYLEEEKDYMWLINCLLSCMGIDKNTEGVVVNKNE